MAMAKKLFLRRTSSRLQLPSKEDIKSAEPLAAPTSCSLMVIGAEGVGKTALTVRFLAKRFLHEYDAEKDQTYLRTLQIDEKMLGLTMIDKSGKNILKSVTTIEGLDALQGIIVVFSLTDSLSFDTCLDLLDFFKFDCQSTINLPVLVIGNKSDLEHLRVVGNKEATNCVLNYPGCTYEECSAAAQDETVEVVFRSFIKQAMGKSDLRQLDRNGRKVSVGVLGSPKIIRAHFKRRFSMFGRDRTGSN